MIRLIIFTTVLCLAGIALPHRTEWTWLAGGNIPNQHGNYGEKGVSHTSISPGGRAYAFGWFDSLRQEFWLFGGTGIGSDPITGTLVCEMPLTND
mgnify:CR=1 FL=1